MATWWDVKLRQTMRHLTGRVTNAERDELRAWLSPTQARLFDSMHRADQRHGLDVVARLRADGHHEEELLLAGLLHDCSKGRGVRLPHRVAWSLGERYGERVLDVFRPIPGFAAAFERIGRHADDSARLALAAGCSERTADLIRNQEAPRDPVAGVALQRADEAS